MRRYDHVANLRGIGRLQTRLVRCRDRCRKRLHWAVEGRALDPFRNEVFELLDHVRDDQLGLDDLVLHPLPEQADRAVEDNGIFRVALQIVLIVGERLERRGAVARREIRIEGLKPVHMVDRQVALHLQERGRKTGEISLVSRLEDVIGDLICRGQPGTIDCVQGREVCSTAARSAARYPSVR
jgi:hypothetical protein